MTTAAIGFKDIEAAVCGHFRIAPAALRSKKRNRENAFRRFIAVSLAREFTTLSLPDIGDRLHKDHTTILAAQRRAAELSKTDSAFAGELAAVRDRLLSAPTSYKERLRRAAQDFAGIKQPARIPADLCETWV